MSERDPIFKKMLDTVRQDNWDRLNPRQPERSNTMGDNTDRDAAIDNALVEAAFPVDMASEQAAFVAGFHAGYSAGVSFASQQSLELMCQCGVFESEHDSICTHFTPVHPMWAEMIMLFRKWRTIYTEENDAGK